MLESSIASSYISKARLGYLRLGASKTIMNVVKKTKAEGNR